MTVYAGEKVQLSVGSAVAQVVSISGPTESRETIDITTLDSTSREFRVSGLRDGGEVSFDVYFDPTSHNSLHDMINDTTASSCSITVNADGSAAGTISFDAFVTGFELSGEEIDGNVTASVTMKLESAPTYS